MGKHSTKSYEVRRASRLWYRMSGAIQNYLHYSRQYTNYSASRPSPKRCIQARNRHYTHITGRKANSKKRLY